jgi:hypothetical protein
MIDQMLMLVTDSIRKEITMTPTAPIEWKRTARRASATRDPVAEYDAFIGGHLFGSISAEFGGIDKGYTKMVSYTYKLEGYTAWTRNHFNEVAFSVSQYGSSKTALAAAKKWVVDQSRNPWTPIR